MPRDITPVSQTKALWGEGPIWSNDTLFWVDIEGRLVIAFHPATNTEQTWNVNERVGTVVPRATGDLVIAGHHGFSTLDPQTGKLTPIADPESHLPNNRFNDGKCDPAGRFWAGTMDLKKPRQPVAALYRLDPDHSVHQVIDGVTVSNGIVWNRAANTMFYIDTPTEQIVAFPYDNATGSIDTAAKRVVADTTAFEGVPDGMAIDENDNLWVAMCHGGCVRCFDPASGDTLEKIDLPTLEVTAPAFGGPHLADLYLTTGQSDLTKDDPLAGHLLRTQVGVSGVPSFAFRG